MHNLATKPEAEYFDPITVEVVRMRLETIVSEMGIAMMRTAGSPVITEAGDFNTALFDVTGRLCAYSDYIQLHIGSASVAVKKLLEAVPLSQMYPGDAFISNDPHTSGATHPPDVTVVSPIFYEGKPVAFAQSQAHLMDVGGMGPGGFAPAAYDCFSEALRMPPGVKVFERGAPVDSVRLMITNNVRLPVLLWNDIRSLVAANNVGAARLCATLDEFGLDEFDRYMQRGFDMAEDVVRSRIRSLPDGVYEADEWQEHNGHVDDLYRIHCAMTIAGDRLTLDFAGTSPQTDGFVNSSWGSTVGAVATALSPILAWDTPLNHGVFSPITIKAPLNTIVNPTSPSPISNGHIETGMRVVRLVVKLMNMVLSRSEDPVLRERTQGIWPDSWTGGITAGEREKGPFFVLFNMDGGAHGAGAQPQLDGLDCSGMTCQVSHTLPDVEMNELMYPVLYLWRRLDYQTGGPGAQRGGLGLDFAWTLHDCPDAHQTVFAPTAQVPAEGYGGGYPGGGSEHQILRNTNIMQALRAGGISHLEDIAFERKELLELSAQGIPIRAGDIFWQRIAGGGGYGDPLLRDPALVVRDLRSGYIAEPAAYDVYGVVLAEGGQVADLEATAGRRAELRRQRIGKPVKDAAREGELPAGAEPVSKGVAMRDGAYVCLHCGTELGVGGDWHDHCHTHEAPASERLAELHVRIRPRHIEPAVMLREDFCPGCGTALDAQVVVKTH
ncbi:hydantoinase B/oxoprolinase family protein [Xanthobacter sp. KR7-225]|uniref:hydantoinase B/oxoprolinase family protein n=1 Tax=Xanthobacter sp. KR7-225 TaxID=3156613 RepID=UPI0032B4BA19